MSRRRSGALTKPWTGPCRSASRDSVAPRGRSRASVRRAVEHGVDGRRRRRRQLLRADGADGRRPGERDCAEELFGPVASPCRRSEEAVALANDTPFGLGSYVMTNDPQQAERVVDRIDAGMVYVNIVGCGRSRAAVRRHEALRLRTRSAARRRRVRQQEADPNRLSKRIVFLPKAPGIVQAC